MLAATDRRGNPLFAPVPHLLLHKLPEIGPALPVLLVLLARACGHGRVDGGRPVSRESIAADSGVPPLTVRKRVRSLVELGIVLEERARGSASSYRIATAYFWGRTCRGPGSDLAGSGGRTCGGPTSGSKSVQWQQLDLALDVVDVKTKVKRVSPAPPSALRKRFRTTAEPAPEPPPGAPPLPWVHAVRAGLNGTAGRRPEVARAVYGAVSHYVRRNREPDPAAVTRAVVQYCRTVVDRGLFPGVSPWAYLPAAIAGKADDALEDRLEREAAGRRAELARERSRK